MCGGLFCINLRGLQGFIKHESEQGLGDTRGCWGQDLTLPGGALGWVQDLPSSPCPGGISVQNPVLWCLWYSKRESVSSGCGPILRGMSFGGRDPSAAAPTPQGVCGGSLGCSISCRIWGGAGCPCRTLWRGVGSAGLQDLSLWREGKEQVSPECRIQPCSRMEIPWGAGSAPVQGLPLKWEGGVSPDEECDPLAPCAGGVGGLPWVQVTPQEGRFLQGGQHPAASHPGGLFRGRMCALSTLCCVRESLLRCRM